MPINTQEKPDLEMPGDNKGENRCGITERKKKIDESVEMSW